MQQTLLHVAIGVHRSNPDSKGNIGMKFVESLIKNKFSMHLTDSNDETPMDYLMTDSVPESALLPVIKVAVKYGFSLLS